MHAHGQAATKKTPAILPKSVTASHPEKRAAAPDYTEDVRSDGEAVTVLLNGWPIADMQGGQHAGLINYALVDGPNYLAVTIAPPPGGKPGSVDIATVLIQNGAKNVLSVQWKARTTPPPPLPLHQAATFQSGTHFGPRVWQTAAPITLDEATKAAIRAQIHRLHDLLETKDLNGMVQLFAVRDREDALSHGESPEQNTAAARKDYQQMLADPHWRMAPVHDDRLQFHLLADKRVVLADYGKDTQVLTTLPTPSGDITAFELYLSQVNGQWIIVH
ncbi:hypothetical protein A0257_16335 [Hymenobacter psoromatis]|nr:hypothetical protein A0257_16335 [Hymenobacter psoromatis]